MTKTLPIRHGFTNQTKHEDPTKVKDLVEIHVYGEVEYWPRKEAINFYSQAAAATEGSEHHRYRNILFDLQNNESVCSDEI